VAKFGLGKGLGALIPEHQQFFEQVSEEGATSLVKLVPIEHLTPNPDQPRKHFSQESLDELADSIRRHGLLQPLLVQEAEPDRYIIIAGERRYRAAQIAGLSQVPVIVRSQEDENTHLELSLVENIQREDLDPIEEAQAYARLMELTGATQERIAQMVGKSRVAVANTLRLLKLPEDMQRALKQGAITSGHARALLSIEDSKPQRELFERIQHENLSVRQTEQEIQKIQFASQNLQVPPNQQNEHLLSDKSKKRAALKAARADAVLDPLLRDLKQKLIERLGTKVEVAGDLSTGTITVHYFSQEDLERIFEALGFD